MQDLAFFTPHAYFPPPAARSPVLPIEADGHRPGDIKGLVQDRLTQGGPGKGGILHLDPVQRGPPNAELRQIQAAQMPALLAQVRSPEEGETLAQQTEENQAARKLLSPRTGYSTAHVPDVGAVRLHERPLKVAGMTVGVAAGQPLASVEHAQHGLAGAFLLAGALVLVIALVASYVAGVRVSAPLRRMAQVAARVDAGELTQLEWVHACADDPGVDVVDFDGRYFPRTEGEYLAQHKKLCADRCLTVASVSGPELFGGTDVDASLAAFLPGARIGDVHGRPQRKGGRTILPLYHPSYALRNPGARPVLFHDIQVRRALLREVGVQGSGED